MPACVLGGDNVADGVRGTRLPTRQLAVIAAEGAHKLLWGCGGVGVLIAVLQTSSIFLIWVPVTRAL
jgi:TM2 domain-containing membrane protein YozV